MKYRDTGGLFNDLYSGQLAFTHIDMTTIAGQLKSGKLRALHVTSAKRLALPLRISPAAEEAGVPNMDVATWWSVHVPAKTPAPICEKLETLDFNAMMQEPDVIKFHTDVGGDMMPGNSKSLRELLIKQTELWKKLRQDRKDRARVNDARGPGLEPNPRPNALTSAITRDGQARRRFCSSPGKAPARPAVRRSHRGPDARSATCRHRRT